MNTTATTNTAEVAIATLELISRGDTGPAVDQCIHPDCIDHRGSGQGPSGRDGFRKHVSWLNAGFADVSIVPQDVIASDDKVVVRTRFTGLHVGIFQGVAPTQQTIDCEQIHIFRIENGMVAEHWMCMDEVAALSQMGVTVRGHEPSTKPDRPSPDESSPRPHAGSTTETPRRRDPCRYVVWVRR